MDTPPHLNMYEEYRQLAADIRAAQSRMAEVRAEASSEDDLITAVVGSSGELVELRLDSRIYRAPDSAQLAADITDAVHRAAELARQETFSILSGFLPPDASPETADLRADPMLHELDRQVAGEGR
ncbi:YbaB/EbfC family nucleoid-associated protein [Amycolatopsis circi]|uniref:YbaB/EbfC family nucleoid-associated protein n=1 Tax=Amycolatopsis circi TaxID=871959 RepID=UPI000E24B770|nr:YbaB/EbfC family nucleoid-associated protein [Amycolatopsis circi]